MEWTKEGEDQRWECVSKAIREGFRIRDEANQIDEDFWENPTQERLLAAWHILRTSFRIALNANDLFYWGASDETEVESRDMKLLIEATAKFGTAGEVAMQQKIRGFDEDINCLDRRSWANEYPDALKWLENKIVNHELEELKTSLEKKYLEEAGLELSFREYRELKNDSSDE